MAGKYLKDKAYEMIREKIVNCELAPGSVLNESELIEEIGASRTPIREALNKLEQENLVTIIPKKCIIVRGITIDDIAEVFDARAVIEPPGAVTVRGPDQPAVPGGLSGAVQDHGGHPGADPSGRGVPRDALPGL